MKTEVKDSSSKSKSAKFDQYFSSTLISRSNVLVVAGVEGLCLQTELKTEVKDSSSKSNFATLAQYFSSSSLLRRSNVIEFDVGFKMVVKDSSSKSNSGTFFQYWSSMDESGAVLILEFSFSLIMTQVVLKITVLAIPSSSTKVDSAVISPLSCKVEDDSIS